MISYSKKYASISSRYEWLIEETYQRNLSNEPVNWDLCPDAVSNTFFDFYLQWRIFHEGKAGSTALESLKQSCDRVGEAAKRNAFERTSSPMGARAFRLSHLRTKLLATAFRDGTSLDRAVALQISEDERKAAAERPKGMWDGLPQSVYLDSIYILLLVDAGEEAAAMVKEARTMRALNVKELFELAKTLALGSKRMDSSSTSTFRTVFDTLRDPDYDDKTKGHLGSRQQLLVLACIWQKYFDPADGKYSLDRAIDLIWE